MPQYVEILDDGDLRTLRLNRPERRNALGVAMRASIREAVDDTAECPAKIVVLEGAGPAFSAGADLKGDGVPGQGRGAPEASGRTWRQRRTDAGRWQRLMDDIEALPQVTIASVHGYAIGGAFLLASACDLRVASEDAFFSIPEVALGVPLTWAGIPRLAREVGISRTRELILTARRVPATEAREWGFVHRVGDRESETRKLVQELLDMPEAPLLISKDALRAYGRTVVNFEGAWADPDLIHWSGREPESAQAAVEYTNRTVNRRRE